MGRKSVSEQVACLSLASADHPDLPERDYMDDDDDNKGDNKGIIKWKFGKPNFDLANRKYLAEKTRSHPAGSLERVVENLVKTWEMESTHKVDATQWGTINLERYHFRCNGGPPKNVMENIDRGNYNMMMEDSPLYDAAAETNESALGLFKSAFATGFAWELLDLLSGPPKVSFTWRHWAHWTGPFRGNQPTGELMEIFGSAVVEVDENLKIVDLQVFFDPHPLMARLMRKQNPAGNKQGITSASAAATTAARGGIESTRCPFQH